jgi:hypothetical protein
MRPLNRPAVHLALIAVLGLLVYSNTFQAPFQWDDRYDYLLENPVVKDLGYFAETSRAAGLKHYDALRNRYIGYLTFALNYKIHGLDVKGYHIVNIAVHLINSMLVYWLVLLTFGTPFLAPAFFTPSPAPTPPLREGREGEGEKRYIALFTALLFVSHPIQTEAVTYIFQRLTSLAALFYLASVAFYVKWRLKIEQRSSAAVHPSTSSGCMVSLSNHASYILSLVSAALAMKTKENAFTLPIMVALYEFLFFKGRKGSRILYLIPLLPTLFIIPLTLISADNPAGEVAGGEDPAAGSYQGISRADYLFTQFRVIVTYMRLLFLPVNQNIDYDYPVFHSFFNPQVFSSFLFLLSVLCSGIYLLHRSKSDPFLRVPAFGIFWFFIALSVESSIIPIPMVINEYRAYLPSVGLFAVLSTVVFLVSRRWRRTKTPALAGAALVIAVLSGAAYARNGVWGNEISLWEDVIKKSPLKARGYDNLGNAYFNKKMYDRAEEHYAISLRLNPQNAKAHNNLGFISFYIKGDIDGAIEHYSTSLSLAPDRAKVHLNLAIAYKAKGLPEEARKHFERARRLDRALFEMDDEDD